MNLKKFIENLEEIVKVNPEALNYEVVSSKDDEGNGFNTIYYSPTLGVYDDKDFETEENLIEEGEEDFKLNAVCIN